MQVKSTRWWNDVTVTKISKIMFSEKLIKHTVRELPTLVSEAKKKTNIESDEPKFARRPRSVVTSVTFLFLFAYRQDITSSELNSQISVSQSCSSYLSYQVYILLLTFPHDIPVTPKFCKSPTGHSLDLVADFLGSKSCINNVQVYTVLTQLYRQIYINISTTCFCPYGHRQVGYDIRGKSI